MSISFKLKVSEVKRRLDIWQKFVCAVAHKQWTELSG